MPRLAVPQASGAPSAALATGARRCVRQTGVMGACTRPEAARTKLVGGQVRAVKGPRIVQWPLRRRPHSAQATGALNVRKRTCCRCASVQRRRGVASAIMTETGGVGSGAGMARLLQPLPIAHLSKQGEAPILTLRALANRYQGLAPSPQATRQVGAHGGHGTRLQVRLDEPEIACDEAIRAFALIDHMRVDIASPEIHR